MASRGPKSSRALFRDCLRLIKHMAGVNSPKAQNLRGIVAAQFRANAHVTDPAKLHVLQQGSVLEGMRGGGCCLFFSATLSFFFSAICLPNMLPFVFTSSVHANPFNCLYSAERGLSNYLIFHSSKNDPKVAAHAADVGQYADDEEGNLYKKG